MTAIVSKILYSCVTRKKNNRKKRKEIMLIHKGTATRGIVYVIWDRLQMNQSIAQKLLTFVWENLLNFVLFRNYFNNNFLSNAYKIFNV